MVTNRIIGKCKIDWLVLHQLLCWCICCCSKLRRIVSHAFVYDREELLCIEDAEELLSRFQACGDDAAVAQLHEISGVNIDHVDKDAMNFDPTGQGGDLDNELKLAMTGCTSSIRFTAADEINIGAKTTVKELKTHAGPVLSSRVAASADSLVEV
jgi:hypothetical protein